MPSPGAQKKYINKKTTRSSTHTLTSTLKIRHTRYNTNPKTQYYAGLQGFKGLSILTMVKVLALKASILEYSKNRNFKVSLNLGEGASTQGKLI